MFPHGSLGDVVWGSAHKKCLHISPLLTPSLTTSGISSGQATQWPDLQVLEAL